MRDTLKLAFLAGLILAAGCSTYDRELMGDPQPEPVAAEPQPAYTDAESPSPPDTAGVGEFDELRYYGQWHWMDEFGWVWRPTVVSEWQPFTHGHWIWSQYGWMWVDYDPWGWATAHYGYWTWDFAMGWVWIPDYTWSPSQCDWFLYDDTICWSPVPPPGVKFKEPWEGEKAWVSVPVRRFKEVDVANYRTTPKFKPDAATRIARSAPDVREIESRGPNFPLTEVQLERRVVGEHEFARVKLPPDQEKIIQNQRTRAKTNSTRAHFTPPPSSQPPSSGNTGNDNTVGPKPQPTESKAKSKGSGAKNDDNNGAKKESKYKDRKDDDKKEESKSGKKKG